MHAQHQQGSFVGVLIVDDHESYRTVAVEVVHATPGFEVIGSAASRVETLRCIRDCCGPVDLILMDINLGADDGVTLTAELTAEPGHPDIVFVSALAFDDLPVAALASGARGYLPKAQLSPRALSQLRAGVYDWPHDSTADSSR